MKRETARSLTTWICGGTAGLLFHKTADFNHPWLAVLYFVGLVVGFTFVWVVLFAVIWPRGDA